MPLMERPNQSLEAGQAKQQFDRALGSTLEIRNQEASNAIDTATTVAIVGTTLVWRWKSTIFPAYRVCDSYIERVLRQKLPQSALASTSVEYVITVPAVWSDRAQAAIRRCAEQAGMGTGSSLHIISEPEAAAMYALDAMDPHNIQIGDTFVLCDAGGGTVDLISYKVSALKPVLRIQEATPGSGSLCGSTFLNRVFQKFLEDRVKSDRNWDEDVLEEAMKRFEVTVASGTGGETEKRVNGSSKSREWYTSNANPPMSTMKSVGYGKRNRSLDQQRWTTQQKRQMQIIGGSRTYRRRNQEQTGIREEDYRSQAVKQSAKAEDMNRTPRDSRETKIYKEQTRRWFFRYTKFLSSGSVVDPRPAAVQQQVAVRSPDPSKSQLYKQSAKHLSKISQQNPPQILESHVQALPPAIEFASFIENNTISTE
ncbi:MAG: hypothetical protein Q9218_003366 [Villophora microphyllina]